MKDIVVIFCNSENAEIACDKWKTMNDFYLSKSPYLYALDKEKIMYMIVTYSWKFEISTQLSVYCINSLRIIQIPMKSNATVNTPNKIKRYVDISPYKRYVKQ